MARPTAPFGTSIAVTCLLLAGACGDSSPRSCPNSDSGSPKNPIVHDKEVQKVISFYQVSIFSNLTKKGAPLSCNDIPSKYRPNSPELALIRTSKINRAKVSSEAEVVKNFTFKVNTQMVLVAEGVSVTSSGNHIVARGCVDKLMFRPCEVIPVGWDKPLEIDLKPTTGGPCSSDAGCEPNMICITDMAGFTGGYCAKVYCASDGVCPPASVCIADQKRVGICVRKCSEMGDCWAHSTQGFLECDGRRGGVPNTCPRACIPSLFATGYKCSSTSTSSQSR